MNISFLFKRKWLIAFLGSSVFMISYFHRVNIAALSDYLVKDLRFSATYLGMLSSSYFYIYGVEQIISGVMSDVVRPKRLIMASALFMALGSIIFSFSHGFGMALLARILIGIGAGFSFIPLLKIMATWFDENEFSTSLGFVTVFGNIGALLATIPFVSLLHVIGWRASLLIIGIISMIFFFSSTILNCGPYAFDSVGIDLEGSVVGVSKKKQYERNLSKTINLSAAVRNGIGAWLSNIDFVLLGLISFLTYGSLMSFQGLWISPFLIYVRQISQKHIGGWLFIIALGSIVGRIITGYITNSFMNNNKKLAIFIGSIIYTSLWFSLCCFVISMPLLLLRIFLFSLGISTSMIIINYLSLIRDISPKENYGTVAGINNLFPFLGTSLFQIFIGLVLERFSFFDIKTLQVSIETYQRVFGIYFITGVLIIILSLLLIKKSFLKSNL